MQKALAILWRKMHYRAMRTHSDIIKAAGARQIADMRGLPIHTVRSWQQRDSIPSEHWQPLVLAEIATLDELSQAAFMRGSAKAS